MKKLTFLLFYLLTGIGMITAQTTTVTGVVISADDGEPIIGASIVVKGTTVGTVTDYDGKFTLSNIPSSATTLVVSYIGMTTKEITISPNVRVVLDTSSEFLDEVLVVAYGKAKKSSFTGSAATLNTEELKNRTVSNISKGLDGLAPGIQVTTGSGQPGEAANIYIRGVASINASKQPLYVVDGIPYDGTLSSINMDDVENITILKDASAGALYGSRGANGVVMITTKKGSLGKTDVNFKVTVGMASRSLPRYETMNSHQFVEAMYSAYYNQQVDRGVSPALARNAALTEMSTGATKIFGNNEQYNPFNYSIAELFDGNGKIRNDAGLLWEDDWLDEVTRNNALRTEYLMSISSGTDKTQYMFSLGYLNENGILETTGFERYSGRVNVETKAKDWLSGGLGANFARTTSNMALTRTASTSSTSNVWYAAMLMGPIYPIYERDRNGAFILDNDGNKIFDYGENRPTGQQQNFNNVATLYDDKYELVTNNLSARTHLDFGDTPDGWSKGLKFSVNFGFDYFTQEQLTYYNPYFGNAKDSDGRSTKQNNPTFSFTFNQLLTYNKSFEKHNFDFLVAHEWYSYEKNYLYAQKTGFPFGGMYELDAASVISDAGSSKDKYRIESYFGRLNYNYDDKYYLSGSYRRDGSSRFHRDNRWGNFWSVGGNYRISQEEFMEQYTWLDNLSARASYGVQGNDAILTSDLLYQNYYPWQALYDLGFSNANKSGAIVKDVSNPDISWESNHNLNIGVDISVFSRLQASLEWYTRKTTDMLLFYPLAVSTGFDGYYRNSGSIRNSGFEAAITGRIIDTKDFDWSMTLMGSTLRNRVLKLAGNGQDIISGSLIKREGEAIDSWYLPRSAGVDPLSGKQLYWATVDGDGNEVDAYVTESSTRAMNSRYVAGNGLPTLYGSIGNNFRYKDFDLSILMSYSIGGKIIDGTYQNLMSFYYTGQAKHVNMERAWKKSGDITDIPKYEIGESIIYNDDMLINASYLTFKNITLGYTLPNKLLKNIGFKDLRFAFIADNIYMFTHLKGMDPQYSISSGPSYTYAPARTLSLSVDVKF